MTEDELVGWRHQLKGHRSEQTPRDSEGQEAWRAAVHGVTESKVTEQMNDNRSHLSGE